MKGSRACPAQFHYPGNWLPSDSHETICRMSGSIALKSQSGTAAFRQSCHFGRSGECLQMANPAIATPADATAELCGKRSYILDSH